MFLGCQSMGAAPRQSLGWSGVASRLQPKLIHTRNRNRNSRKENTYDKIRCRSPTTKKPIDFSRRE